MATRRGPRASSGSKMTLPILHLGIGHGSCPHVSLRHRRLLDRALVEGFLAGRVVGRVHDIDNLRCHPAHHDLEPLSQGYGRGSATLAASCACQKSNSHIQMMKSAKKWRRQNATNGMYGSRRRRVLVERKVRASRVIVGRVRSQQMAEMPLAEHDNVVKT